MAIGKHWIATVLVAAAFGANAEQDDSLKQNDPVPASPVSSSADAPPEPIDTSVQDTTGSATAIADTPETEIAASEQPLLATPVAADPNEPAVAADSPPESDPATADTTEDAVATEQPEQSNGTAGPTESSAAVSPPGTGSGSIAGKSKASAAMDMSQVIALLQQQQKDLAEQRKLLEVQSAQIKGLQQELDVLRAPAPVLTGETVVAMKDEDQAGPPSGQEGVSADAAPQESEDERDKKAGESVARAQTDDPTRDLLTQFPGAWRLPGTTAALAIGGYVKTSVVYNFDPLEIRDRFIVGSIPVDDTSDIEAQSSITASQSRLNFDLREPTDYGLLRAFIEGDFASEDDTFRMRHAFGQWKKVLAGKTWSAFVDTEATPEEVDFEGLNGRINVRQSQIRIMPTLGKSYEFQLSLEDPNPQITNGQGVTRAPDLVASGRFHLLDRLHVKLAMIGRQIRGQREPQFGAGSDKAYAWGSTLSGRFMTPRFDERDSLLFQVNMGDGIGRYVNDLASVGNFDGIFDPQTGDLKLFDILSGYVSWQHWWKGTVRSNFTLGAVDITNPNFVEGSAYKQTIRFSTNLFWTPTPRIDIGAEYLWGKRENENGDNDTATQFQLAARYRF